MKFDYSYYIEEYRKWIEKNKGGIVDPQTATIPELEEFVRNGSTEIDCRLAAQNLRRLANWSERCAVVDISEGNSLGWGAMVGGAECEFWDVHITCMSFDRSTNKRKATNFIPNVISESLAGLFCLSLDLWEKGEQVSKRLKQSKIDGSLSAWESRSSVMSLAIALGTPGSPSLNDSGDQPDFSFLVDEGTSDSRLQEELRELVDYHLEVIENEDGHSREFDRSPYDIYPVEICAIYKVRERLGLKTPVIDHPLLNTPFANPPHEIRKNVDPLLNRVLEKIGDIMPEAMGRKD